MNKVTIEVYDSFELQPNWETYASDYESTEVKEQFKELEDNLLKEFGSELVKAIYIDTTDMDINEIPEVSKIINFGHSFPVVVINGRARFAGVINHENIIKVVKEELAY